MSTKLSGIVLFSVAAIIIFIYRPWFSLYPLAAGDWLFKFPETLQSFPFFPFAWNQSFNNGLGGNVIFLLALNAYYINVASVLFHFFHTPWVVIERVLWFWPYIAVSAAGSYFLFRKIFGQSPFAYIASFIYTTNTYALMLASGGQLGVGMGYALSPFVFLTVVSMLEALKENKTVFQNSIYAGIAFAVQLMFDLRIAYVTLIGVFLYAAFFFLSEGRKSLKLSSLISVVVVPFLVTILLHFFWLLPFALVRQNPLESLGVAFTETGIVKFLSFAKFENTLSLLHPNWPENIFGKVYFMRPEFLLIPIIAFCSLLFLSKKARDNVEHPPAGGAEQRRILFFALLALIGAFLAKGANEPFGSVYIWMFDHIPGFIMFRDPTKWYMLVVVSYSMLIPWSLLQISERLSSIKYQVLRKKIKIPNTYYLIPATFLVFWLFTLKPAVAGQLTGTFQPKEVPQNYAALTKFIHEQPEYFRTLWLPSIHHFSYYSTTHPIVAARDFFQDPNLIPLANKIIHEENIPHLQEASIKYVIVPDDTEGIFFLKDRKYDEKTYQSIVKILRDSPNLTYIRNFGKIAVFEVPDPKDHFWFLDENSEASWEQIDPTHYKIVPENGRIRDILIFSETFDNNWLATFEGTTVRSEAYNDRYNSFAINTHAPIDIYYQPQRWVSVGLIVSGVTILGIMFCFFVLLRKGVASSK